MSHSARSSLSDLSVQTLPLTPAVPSHKRTPSRTYFSLVEEDFSGSVSSAQPEAEVAHGFEKLGFGESVAIGLSAVAVLSLAIVAATVTLLKVKCPSETLKRLVLLAPRFFNFIGARETFLVPVLYASILGWGYLRHLGKTGAARFETPGSELTLGAITIVYFWFSHNHNMSVSSAYMHLCYTQWLCFIPKETAQAF
ncbi:unnamed protein product [Rhizoctonia solani]|uniref:Uncharacterized protein n=1 Tax=Rhizoctonia solani TaxID=456999 RepID=A0A8H2WQ44_9AGAM|nr:unnamed protein product [Rhizoctonia solani]